MKKSNSIILFKQKQVRCIWDEKKELWYFSIIDIIEILTESPRPRKYWNALKNEIKTGRQRVVPKSGTTEIKVF